MVVVAELGISKGTEMLGRSRCQTWLDNHQLSTIFPMKNTIYN
jgi:hypothetical protein